MVWNSMSRPNKSVDVFADQVKANPKDVRAYVNLGDAHERLHQYVEAIEQFTKAIEIDPTHAKAYSLRAYATINHLLFTKGKANLTRSDTQGACEDLAKAIELGDDDKVGHSMQKDFCE
jgi:tetratricopeptide (TPR) repeat protein